MFGFLKKLRKPKKLSTTEVEQLAEMLMQWPSKWINSAKTPEEWPARSSIFMRVELACAVISLVEKWHTKHEAKLSDGGLLQSVFRGAIQQRVVGFSLFEAKTMGRVSCDKLVENRLSIYRNSPTQEDGSIVQSWADLFSGLSILAHDSKSLDILNCKSSEDVFGLLLTRGKFPDALTKYQLNAQFSGIFIHQIPVLVDLIKTLHESRLERWIE